VGWSKNVTKIMFFLQFVCLSARLLKQLFVNFREIFKRSVPRNLDFQVQNVLHFVLEYCSIAHYR